jgi:hypothetical protein
MRPKPIEGAIARAKASGGNLRMPPEIKAITKEAPPAEAKAARPAKPKANRLARQR